MPGFPSSVSVPASGTLQGLTILQAPLLLGSQAGLAFRGAPPSSHRLCVTLFCCHVVAVVVVPMLPRGGGLRAEMHFPAPLGLTLFHGDERAPSTQPQYSPDPVPTVDQGKQLHLGTCVLANRVSEGHCWESSPLGWWVQQGKLSLVEVSRRSHGLPPLFPAWAKSHLSLQPLTSRHLSF